MLNLQPYINDIYWNVFNTSILCCLWKNKFILVIYYRLAHQFTQSGIQ